MNNKPKYNPNYGNHEGLPQRRSIRLKGYDYSQAGMYFITICCQNRECRFGKIKNKEMILHEYGTMANDEWIKLTERFPNFELDVFQIMPNHMHGIILLNDIPVGAGFTPARNNNPTRNDISARNDSVARNNSDIKNNTPARNDSNPQIDSDIRATAMVAPTVSDIVGAYKSLVANGCLNIYKSKNETMGKLWHRNFHEHIIRNEKSYHRISEYIINNPANWQDDKF